MTRLPDAKVRILLPVPLFLKGDNMESLIKKYSKEQLEQIIKNSNCYSDVLRKLGYETTHGSNHITLKKYIKLYNIDISHFEKTYKYVKRTNEEIFKKDSEVSQHCLRDAYIKGNYTEYKCSICGQEPFWNGKPLTLTLDHINGKNHDNELSNLRWVCPNCDRQLDTFGYKNIKNLT